MRDFFKYMKDAGIDSLLVYLSGYFEFALPVYNMICRYASKGSKLLEVGFGSGFLSMWLAQSGYNVTCIDADDQIVALCKDNAMRLRVPDRNLTILRLDARNLSEFYHSDPFTLSFSMGVLEHFSRMEAREIIKEQAKVSRMTLNIIPSTRSNTFKTMRTAERAYSMKEWKQLHREAGLTILRCISFGNQPRCVSYLFPLAFVWLLRKANLVGSAMGVLAKRKVEHMANP